MKVLFDTDPGVDDAMALYYALAHPNLDVMGITTTFGNVTVQQATENALYLCAMAGFNTPVASGASQPIDKPAEAPPVHIHGQDGLGNLLGRSPHHRCAVSQNAAEFLVETVRANPHEITVVAVGPLTNIAAALALDKDWASQVKRLVIMGGAVHVPGNVTAFAEANIWNDPHAAAAVFAADWQVDVVSLDVTHQVIIPAKLIESLATHHTHPAMDALNQAVRFYANFYSHRHPDTVGQIGGCFGHDVLAFMALTNPEYFQTEAASLTVVIAGDEAGRTVFQASDGGPHVTYRRVDAPACLAAFDRTLRGQWLR